MWNCKENAKPHFDVRKILRRSFFFGCNDFWEIFWTSEPQKEEPAKLSPTGVSVPAGLDREPPVRLKIYIQTLAVRTYNTVGTDLYSIEYLT